MTVKLAPGKFYKSRDGEVWCCFRVREDMPEHAQADCVRVEDHRVEYFYADGRYDGGGKREHTLVAECGPKGEGPRRCACGAFILFGGPLRGSGAWHEVGACGSSGGS